MASLVCRWLKMVEEDDVPASTAAIPGVSAAAGAVSPADGNTAAGGRGQAAAGRELDEPFYLRQLAKERFDPHYFATVFTSGGSGAPQWLSGLIAEPGKWRFAQGGLRDSATAAGAKRGQQPHRHTLQRPAGLARQLLPSPCLATCFWTRLSACFVRWGWLAAGRLGSAASHFPKPLPSAEGRSLVYELAGKYKNSLLLNFAIHKILMQPGREKEVREAG